MATMLALADRLVRSPSLYSLVSPAPPAAARDGLVLDLPGREARIDGTRISLTFQEFELLGFLMAGRRRVFSRRELLEAVWGRRRRQDGTRTVDVHIHRLRRKLGPEYGRCIVTVRQAGYKFTPFLPHRSQPVQIHHLTW